MSTNAFQVPPVDVYENPEEILVVADVPGLAPDGLSIELERDQLRIEGRRIRADHGEALESTGAKHDYQRAFAIPEGIDRDAVRAELKQGVLTLHLPKAASLKPRKIDVQPA